MYFVFFDRKNARTIDVLEQEVLFYLVDGQLFCDTSYLWRTNRRKVHMPPLTVPRSYRLL